VKCLRNCRDGSAMGHFRLPRVKLICLTCFFLNRVHPHSSLEVRCGGCGSEKVVFRGLTPQRHEDPALRNQIELRWQMLNETDEQKQSEGEVTYG
jgi:ribosomal protein S27E